MAKLVGSVPEAVVVKEIEKVTNGWK